MRAGRRVGPGEKVVAAQLTGGVSNEVLLITLPDRGERFVLKQARPQLRTKEIWHSSIDRIWREVETLEICASLMADRSKPQANAPSVLSQFRPVVPDVLWTDRENYLYAMTAAPDGHKTWKQLLLAGETTISLGIATACGTLLGQLHARSWRNSEIADRLDDRTFFDELRLDPYYRHTARVHTDLAPQFAALINSVWEHRLSLVHGDYSPKNVLVSQGQAMLIDFEVGHFGDPAFDLGFLLTHLLLKGIWAGPKRTSYLRLANGFWGAYLHALSTAASADDLLALENRTLLNLAGCTLARIDGKSPVDYLSPAQQQEARNISRNWLLVPPENLRAAFAALGG